MLRKKQGYEKRNRKSELELKKHSFIHQKFGTVLQRIALMEILEPIRAKYYEDREPYTFKKMRETVIAAKIAAEHFFEQNGSDKQKISCPEEAKIGLMELVETVSFEEKDKPIHELLWGKTSSIHIKIANGLTAYKKFTEVRYKYIFETKGDSLYHLITSAIYFSAAIKYRVNPITKEENKDKVKNGNCTYLSTPLDWTIALYNLLCYHLRVYTKRRSKPEEWNDALFLCACVCEVLSGMLKGLEGHGF